MADIVSFSQPNGEPTVSVAIGNDPDVTVAIANGSAAPQPKQHGVMAIHRNDDNIRTVYETTKERLSGCGWLLTVIRLIEAIGMITIGSIHLHNCPVEQFIPVFLVFGGVLKLAEMIREHSEDGDNGKLYDCGCVSYCLLQTLLYAWYIAGSVWLYSVWHKVSYNSSDTANYCHQLPYFIAMVQVTTMWSCLALVLFIFIVAKICACLCAAVAD